MDDSFLGNALNAIDAKNRVSIPAAFREVLSTRSDSRALVLSFAERAECLVGFDPGYPAKVKAELEARFAGEFTEARDDRFRAAFGPAERFPIDDNGRINISQTMKDAADLDGVALFWGMGDFFEIWKPTAFLARPGLDPRVIRMVERQVAARK